MNYVQSLKTKSGNYLMMDGNLSWYENEIGQFLRLAKKGEWEFAEKEWESDFITRETEISVSFHKGGAEASFWNPELGIHSADERWVNSSMVSLIQEWIFIVKMGENVVKIISRLDSTDTVIYPATA